MKHLLRLNGEKENIEIEEGHIHFSTYEELAEFDKRLDDGEVFKRAVSKNITIRKFCRDFSTYYLSCYFFIYSVKHLNQKLSSLHLLVFDIFCVFQLSKYGLIGGKDCGDNTRRILSLLIDHKLACVMNWSGRNKKRSLESLHKVIDLICGKSYLVSCRF